MLTRTVARLLLLPTLVVALGVLVKGYADVGDGFSAGIIAAMGVVLQYLVSGAQEVERFLPVHRARWAATIGLFLALSVSFGPLLLGRPLLSHFPEPDAPVIHLGTLELHTAVVFDVGVFLLVLGFVLSAIRTFAHVSRERPR